MIYQLCFSGIDEEQGFVINVENPKEVHYYRQISSYLKNLYRSPLGGCIIKNCTDDKELLQFASMGEFEKFQKDNRKQMWLHLKLKAF